MCALRFLIIASLLVGVVPRPAAASAAAKSLHGFSADDCEVVPELVGTWNSPSDTYSIREIDDKKYWMIHQEAESETGNRIAFEICLVHVDGHLFYDATFQVLRPGDEPTLPPNFVVLGHNLNFDVLEGFWIPMHIIGRLEIEKNTLHFCYFESEWLQDVLKSRLVSVASTQNDSGEYFLIATSKELKAFVARFATDPKAFSKEDYTRVLEGKPNRAH